MDLSDDQSPEGYCRAVEAYLCRKNDGHLVRIVGPAFEQVCGWAVRGGEDRSLDPVLETIVRELDAARTSAKSLRGDARAAFVERLRALDEMLLAAARGQCDAAALQRLGSEADAELAPFRDRMPRDAFEQSRRACIDRLIRERARLPLVTYD